MINNSDTMSLVLVQHLLPKERENSRRTTGNGAPLQGRQGILHTLDSYALFFSELLLKVIYTVFNTRCLSHYLHLSKSNYLKLLDFPCSVLPNKVSSLSGYLAKVA